MSNDITLTDADAQADLAGTPRPDNPTIPAYQSRVYTEHHEVALRASKLAGFFGSKVYDALSDEEKDRMKRQLTHMVAYRDVLAERIAAF